MIPPNSGNWKIWPWGPVYQWGHFTNENELFNHAEFSSITNAPFCLDQPLEEFHIKQLSLRGAEAGNLHGSNYVMVPRSA